MSYYFFFGSKIIPTKLSDLKDYISYKKLAVIPLPVTPGALTIKTPSKNQAVTLINEGEVSLLKSPGLKEISFKALLPQNKYPFANYGLSGYDATAFIAALKVLEGSKIPFCFTVTRMTPKGKPLFFTSLLVTLEDYTLEENAEEGTDVILDITLKEYRYYGTTVFKEIEDPGGRKAIEVSKTRDTATKAKPGEYIVKKGDTLWSIAKKELGDESMEEWLWRWNKDLIECPQRGTKELQPGMVLKIRGPMYSIPTQGGTGKLLLPDLADEQYSGGLHL